MADWYPQRESEIPPWHVQFVASCMSYSVTLGSVLTAPVLAQIGVNRDNSVNLINYAEAATNFGKEVTAFKAIMFKATLGTPLPPVPTVPSVLSMGLGSVAGIEPYTRALVAQIKAHPAYTEAMGQDMGIIGGSSPVGQVGVTATALTQSQVALRIAKAGYSVVAVDSRRGGGDWEQIALLTLADYIDQRPPLVANAPEVRDYRCQGYADNQRTGPMSDIVTVVTVP